ncbi:hypothetical protein ACQP25_04655 [Microtetraspora malaysiensis]|uniref:hypothetical protein n=1 Tax=Microtetraspora malaysiensis TaxID=161358 RepID=UPI003D8A0EF9
MLPALTAAISLLKQQDPAEADNFRRTVIVAIDAATRPQKGEPSPTMVEMARKITAALDAAADSGALPEAAAGPDRP